MVNNGGLFYIWCGYKGSCLFSFVDPKYMGICLELGWLKPYISWLIFTLSVALERIGPCGVISYWGRLILVGRRGVFWVILIMFALCLKEFEGVVCSVFMVMLVVLNLVTSSSDGAWHVFLKWRCLTSCLSSDGAWCASSSDGTWQVVYQVMMLNMLVKWWCLMCFLKWWCLTSYLFIKWLCMPTYLSSDDA